MNTKKTILVLLLCCIFVVSAGVATVALAEDVDAPTSQVYCSDNIEVNKGNGFYMYVYAKDFDNVAGLDLYVYYDESVFTLGSIGKGAMLGGTLSDVNTSTGGTICLSMVSAKGISGDGTLLSILFYVKSDVAEGKYIVNVAAGDCYDTTLAAVALTTNNCRINVKKAPEITQIVSFGANCGVDEAKKGDSFDVVFCTNNSRGFATANFEVEYDNTLLRLDGASFGSSLTAVEGVVYSVNSDVAGYVGASYAALNDVPDYLSQAFVVRFTVVGDKDVATKVSFKASGLYNSQLVAYKGSECEADLQLVKLPEIVVNPKVSVRSMTTAERRFAVQIVAPAGSGIAAGDFYVSFDETSIECVDIKSVADGCMVVGNPSFADGQARFSFICEDGIISETVIAEMTFDATAACGAELYLVLQGKNLYDGNFAEVVVDYVDGKVVLQHKFNDEFTVDMQPSCTNSGIKSKHCVYCDAESELTSIAPLGHDLVHHEVKAATCTEKGWSEYDTCSRCNYTTYEELSAKGHTEVVDKAVAPTCTEIGLTEGKHCSVCNEVLEAQQVVGALGHDLVHHIAKAATCTEKGWNEYDTCSRCDYSTYSELAAKGHAEVVDKAVAPTCTETGLTEGKHCADCGEVLVAQSVVAVLDHDMGEWRQTKASGCTEVGEERRNCSRCEHFEVRDVAAVGHKKSNTVEENRVEATCTAGGHYDSVVYCSACGIELDRVYETIAPVGHNEVWIVDKEATCTEDGSRHKECSVCHENLASETIVATGHDFGDWITVLEPTTDGDGKKVRKCKSCGYEEEETFRDEIQYFGCFGTLQTFGGITATFAIVVAAVLVVNKRRKSE